VSLYATFFPSHFNGEFFANISAGVNSWENFWRPTDPIASPIMNADNKKIAPDASGRVRWHSDYWIEHQQVASVNEQLTAELRP